MTPPYLLEELLRQDGRGPLVSEASWFDLVEHVVATLDVGPGTRVCDVTCGAGSFLWPLAQNGYIVSGYDSRPEPLESAKAAMPGGWFAVADPWAFDPADPVDVVVASRGFSECSSSDHARGMLARMLAKATHAVALLDIDEEVAPAGVDRVRLFRMLAELGAGTVQFEHDASGRFMAFVKV
jgi:SAM-dependent methyltransferase